MYVFVWFRAKMQERMEKNRQMASDCLKFRAVKKQGKQSKENWSIYYLLFFYIFCDLQSLIQNVLDFLSLA